MLVRGKTSIYFAIKFSLRKISYVVYVQASRARANDGKIVHSRMRNAILRNHFNRTHATTYSSEHIRVLQLLASNILFDCSLITSSP